MYLDIICRSTLLTLALSLLFDQGIDLGFKQSSFDLFKPESGPIDLQINGGSLRRSEISPAPINNHWLLLTLVYDLS